jgi:hypothetical protein
MNFIEEKTPKGFLIKILFDNWQFLAFNRQGKSIYADKEGKSLLHEVPVLVFVGSTFQIRTEFDKEYALLKIRNGAVVVPYLDLKDRKTKYFFLETDKEMDAIPVRMMQVSDVAMMVRDMDVAIRPNYVVVDDTVTPNDVIIIKNRYKVGEIVYVELANNYFLAEQLQIPEAEQTININVMSTNPVFLARIHLRTMDLSKINQLLLDFEITALDTEYIMSFLQSAMESAETDPVMAKNMPVLKDLLNSFRFYHGLLEKNEDEVREMIESISDVKKLTPYRTLVSKVKAMYPGAEDQKLYTVYENIVYDKLEELKEKAGA